MNELHLFLVAMVVAWFSLLLRKNKMSMKRFIIMFFVLPFLFYIVFIILIIVLALIYGDN